MQTVNHDADVTMGSQRLLLEAGYDAKPDWIFVDDLVQSFRVRHATSQAMLQALDHFLASAPSPVDRAGFERFANAAVREERTRQAHGQNQARMAKICAEFGIAQPDAAHEAMAQRISELEQAVKSYAERLRAAERSVASAKAGTSLVPFLVGVEIGAVLF